MRRSSFVFSMFAAVVLVSQAAFAQPHPMAVSEAPHAVEITPFVGYGANMTSMMGNWSDNAFNAHAGTGPAFGGRVAFRLGEALFVETAVGFSRPTHMTGDGGLGHMGGYVVGPRMFERQASSLTYEGNVLYEFRSSRWAPYLTAGAGAFTTWMDGVDTWTDPAANVGVGLKFYAQPRVALRFDVREYVGSFRDITNATTNLALTSRSWGAHPQLTFGVGFGF